MIYKDFHGLKLSSLGMGCMRLPTVEAQESAIDEAAAAQMVDLALSGGVNYFDTAWPYHGGNSEIVMGRVLRAYDRDRFCLATKFPAFSADNLRNAPQIFERQLEKCQVDHFDFYLYHNVTERNIDMLLDDSLGIHRYLMEQKRAGRIRHLGFSAHGGRATIRRFLEAYGEDLEFCQLQINYLDWTLQNAKEKVEILREFGLPVWVMEPVRGGRLASLPSSAMQRLEALRPNVSAPEWAFRFLQGIEGVTMILSGMSNEQQLRQNIHTFETEQPLNPQENAALFTIAEELIRAITVPCTACSYCTDRCPQQLPIPQLIKLYNDCAAGNPVTVSGLGPADCVGCRSCEAACPQNIQISQVMTDFLRKLN